jgi:hypothetical protein
MSAPSVGDPCEQLLARARLILEQSGQQPCARLLGRLRVELEKPERWTLSGRDVDAHRGVLFVPGDLILALRAEAGLREQMRAALAAAFDTPTRVLRDLTIVLDDESMSLGAADSAATGHPYRSATEPDCLPHPSILLRAAQTYAIAAGAPDAAQVLARARVVVERPGADRGDGRTAVKGFVLLGLADLARVACDAKLRGRMLDAVHAVLQGPHRTVAEVRLGPDWSLPQPREIPSASPSTIHTVSVLQELLAADGVACAIVEVRDSAVRLIAVLGGTVGIIDVGESGSYQGTVAVAHVRIDPTGADLGQAARVVRLALEQFAG